MLKKILVPIVLLCLLAVSSGAGWVIADEVDSRLETEVERNETIQDAKKDILIIESKIADQKRQIERLKNEKASYENAIAAINLEISKTEEEANLAQLQLDQTQAELSDTEAKIAETEEKMDRQVNLYQDNLNESYIISRSSFIEVMVESDNLSDLVRRLEWNQIIDEQNGLLLAEIKALKEQLDAQKNALEERAAQVEALQTEILNKQQQYEDQKGVQEQLLDETRGLENAYEQVIDENLKARQQLEAEVQSTIRQLETEIRARLEEERKRQEEALRQAAIARGEDPDGVDKVKLTPSRKGYIWPISGVITQRFWQSYPDWMLNAYPWLKIGNYRYHTGTDIGAASGTAVVAPKGGRVVLVRNYGNLGYGKAIMIDHYDGVTTIYGHLSSFSVSEGQSVEQGATIGAVGSTGFSTGSHLHFEVRENGNLLDPLIFLP